MACNQLSPNELTRVFSRIRQIEQQRTPALDVLSEEAISFLDGLKTVFQSYDQGYELARWLREQPGIIVNDTTVNPEAIVRQWGVIVQELSVNEPNFEALAFWGPRHGPGVIVNSLGKRFDRPAALRSILAHEICHLLIDRSNALPLAEVLDGRVSSFLEQRARAFGAEFLLPQKYVVQKFQREDNIYDAMRDLSLRFGASFEIVAWQARNSDAISYTSHGDREYLRNLVSQPDAF
jgi:Zn-dependent peptidase ImmA (M78 family)